jgi:murein L,D-transpeptidase YafK
VIAGNGAARAWVVGGMRMLRRPIAAAIAGSAALAAVALSWPRSTLGEEPCRAPEIRVFKREGVVELRCEGTLRHSAPATFGASPVGPKEREGDERTPEGAYRVTARVKNDRFHRFLAISYPNDDDKRRAREKGITRLGGGIGIHGTRRGLAGLARMWTRVASATGLASVWGPTDGCVGVTNEDSEVFYRLAPVGTPVIIAPARPAGG